MKVGTTIEQRWRDFPGVQLVLDGRSLALSNNGRELGRLYPDGGFECAQKPPPVSVPVAIPQGLY